MKLGPLLEEAGLGGSPITPDARVSGITYDSRQVSRGSLFVAISGQQFDGHDYLKQAARNGAVLAVVEHPVDDAPLPILVVPEVRAVLADLACAFYENPSQVIPLVGITGTNGKTTCSYLVESILKAAGHITALIGTVETRLDGQPMRTVKGVAARTTPEAPELMALLSRMVADGGSAAVMEVSSHALAQERVRGCAYDIGVFTNLTRDHLDFHGTMENYFAAKAKLFDGLCPRAAVINIDDEWGQKLAKRLYRPLIYSMKGGFEGDVDTLVPRNLEMGTDGIRFSVTTPLGTLSIESPLVGEFNVYNLLAAIGAGTALGLPNHAICSGIARAASVPGRLERIKMGQPFTVLVDYAHTTDALVRVLDTIRPLAAPHHKQPVLSNKFGAHHGDAAPLSGRVISVVGCGGDRDPGKRGPMGKAAAEGSDYAIFTADNPRSEDPNTICAAMEQGAQGVPGATFETVLDRESAIRKALFLAQSRDVVLIAGKGHERVQVVGDKSVHFDDREMARNILRERG